MIPTASSSMSRRTSAGGHPRPTTCSFRFSPLPSPSRKRPPLITATVAAFWATIAGWYRTVGQVTSDTSSARRVSTASAPSTDHAYALCSCDSSHGWMWSEIVTKSNPASSARRACSSRTPGGWSSHIRLKP